MKLVDVRRLLFVVVALTLIGQPLFGRQTTTSPKPVTQTPTTPLGKNPMGSVAPTPAGCTAHTRPRPMAHTRPRSKGGNFIVLDDGVEVLRLFQQKIPRGGEVAILRLSQKKYDEFVQNPKKFVNETYCNRIFLFQVNDVTAAERAPTAKAGDDMVVMIGHDGGCFGKYIAEMLP